MRTLFEVVIICFALLQFILQCFVLNRTIHNPDHFFCIPEHHSMATSLVLSPLSDNVLEWPEIVAKHLMESQAQHLKYKEGYFNFRGIVAMGQYSTKDPYLPEGMVVRRH